jgi:hypothetical protein
MRLYEFYQKLFYIMIKQYLQLNISNQSVKNGFDLIALYGGYLWEWEFIQIESWVLVIAGLMSGNCNCNLRESVQSSI